MSSKPTLPFLETMITQVCNLSCVGCTNYSDLPHKGYVTWQQGRAELETWLSRVELPDFGIIGGEPLINPECWQWLQGLRNLLPRSQIRFTTNGLLLHRWPDFVHRLQTLGNVSFKISVHVSTPQLEKIIADIFDSFTWQPVNEHGIQRWVTDNNFRFHVKRPNVFVKTYRNSYHDMMPWNSDPKSAFAVCVQQTCPLLYQGKIYKCSTSGLLVDTVTRVAPHNFSHWKKYTTAGIAPDCSDAALLEFIDNFGRPHDQCGQCPGTQTDHKIDHVSLVSWK